MSEETIFHDALAKPSAERAAFLDAACAGQPKLRAAVEALLAAHEDSGSLLDKPPRDLSQTVASDPGAAKHGGMGECTPEPEGSPSHPGTSDFRPQFEPGLFIARRYTLLQKIGEGGMGEVWVAKQSEPVKRKVALKFIKTGMDSKAVLTRFEQERQALAMLDHPNIASVLDGGMTPTGQPFFVMELVNGLALNKFCDEVKLTLRERLEIFVPICQAVQHAHQKGIVHRDLKPANILVTIIDGKPVPKVIDFGVAKATAGRLTDESMSTQFGAVVGTLEYMSPEQAAFSGEGIDTRADIYSLGVILYEMLTGLRPMDAKRLEKAALMEMLRIIRDEEPSKPSMRLSMDESLPSLAALRQIEPKKLMALLRGELDWVVMKCLDKQRERRYETANALARDIQRYLADEAVEARPPSAGYRLSKFLKRNKGPVVAASLVLFALLAGMMGTTWGLFEAKRQEQIAREEVSEKEKARIAEAKQRSVAEGQKEKALQAAEVARKAETKAADEARAARKAEQDAKWQGRLAQEARHAGQIELALRAREEKDYVRMAALIEEMQPEYKSVWETCYVRTLCFRETPLLAALTQGGGTWSTAFSPDGKRVVTWGGYVDGTPRLWDAATGRELAALQKPPFEGYGSHRGLLLVSSVAFSPDGKRVAAGSWNGMARVWDTETGRVKATLRGHAGDNNISVAFSPDGKRVLTGSGDKTARLWDTETGQEKATLKGHTSIVWCVAFSPDGKRVLTGSYDGTARVWDPETGQEKVALRGHTDMVLSVAFSPDGKRVLTGSDDGTARLWDTETGQEKVALRGHTSALYSVAFSPDGQRVLTGSNDGTARVWDAETGQEKIALKGHTRAVYSVVFGPDGQRVLTGSQDRTARVWDAETGREMAVLRHAAAVISVAFSSDGASILTRAENDRPRVWKTEREQEKAPLKLEAPFFAGTAGLALSPDGQRVLTGSNDGTARVRDAETGREMVALKGHTRAVYSVAFSPDGKRVLTGSADNTARLWDAETGREMTVLKGHTGTVHSVAFGPDGQRVLTGSADNTARLWDAETGREMTALKGHEWMVIRVGFSPDGKRVLTESVDSKVRVWDAETGQEKVALRGLKSAFSPDGRHVLTAALTSGGPARILDAETGQEKTVLKGHRGLVNSMAFSPDGTRVVTAGWDKTAVWDAETGQEMAVLKGHTDKVASVAFSPDGKRVLTGSYDGTARVWDAETGQEKVALRGHTDIVFSVAFSHDGKRVLTASNDTTARVWDATTGP